MIVKIQIMRQVEHEIAFYNRVGCYNLNRLDASSIGIQVI